MRRSHWSGICKGLARPCNEYIRWVQPPSFAIISQRREDGTISTHEKLRTNKDLTTYFLSQRDKLKPSDVCSILEGLWKNIVAEKGGCGPPDAKKQLFNDPDFMAIMKDVVFKLDRYKAHDLPRLVAILNAMRWNDKQLFKIVEPMVIQEMPSMTCTGLSQVANSFVAVGCGSRLLYNQLVQCCFQTSNQFAAEEVAVLVSAFSKAPHKPKTFLLGFAAVVSKHLSSFSQQQLQDILLAYSSWPLEVSANFVEEMIRTLLDDQRIMNMSTSNLVLVLRFLALWNSRAKAAREDRTRWKQILSPVFIVANDKLMSTNLLTVEELAHVMWAYCKVKPNGLVPRKLFDSAYQNILPHFKELTVPNLASCLLNTARAVAGHIQFWDETSSESLKLRVQKGDPFGDRRLLDEAETHVVRCMGEMDSRDLTAVVQAYSLSNCGSAELFSAFLHSTTERCRQLAADQLTVLMWSYANVRLGPSFAREIQIDILDRLSQFTVSGICEILWAYCALRHRDQHFFKTLLSTLSPSSVAGNKRCALLCPALLEIRTYFPNMDPEALERYMSYVQHAFRWTQMRSAAPEETRQSLEICLRKIGLDIEQLAIVDGYAIDVLVLPQKELEKPVAIQFHSAPRTLHLRSGEPLGQTMMKQRYLRAKGFCVVNILDKSWEQMGFQEQVSDLAMKIQQAQKQPTGKSFVGKSSQT